MAETPHTPDIEYDAPPYSSLRRRVIVIAIAVLVLLLLVLMPPLINVNRLHRRIATSMSRSLGRPVHLDRITMHLLPMPGFTLENLVVSEDPAFGYEPVIRANEVEATLRVSSLWRRQVEFSTVRFIDPSVNIVRNAQGRWNLEEVLMQAAHANTAPTAQRKAGSAPRFPYIEATGARVNLKLGNQKMPFSLTGADFALWLPSPQQWHLRLQGIPSRTDTDATDTGVVRLEGTLERAPSLAAVPLKLTASWAHAQMGEASLLLTGADAGWRGTLEAGATLTGHIGSARLTGDIHLTDLRRADFVPARLLDVSAHCAADANIALVTLTQAACTIPAGPHPITVSSPSLDLQRPRQAAANIELHAVPLGWALDWAKIFSQRIPAGLRPEGAIDGQLSRSAESAPAQPVIQPIQAGNWTGDLKATLQSATLDGRAIGLAKGPVVFDWLASTPVAAGASGNLDLQLQPALLRLGGSSQLVLTGVAGLRGYMLQLAGAANPAQVRALGNDVLPPFGSQVMQALKPATAISAATVSTPTIATIDVQCSRSWTGPQTCVSIHPVVKSKPRPRRRLRR